MNESFLACAAVDTRYIWIGAIGPVQGATKRIAQENPGPVCGPRYRAVSILDTPCLALFDNAGGGMARPCNAHAHVTGGPAVRLRPESEPLRAKYRKVRENLPNRTTGASSSDAPNCRNRTKNLGTWFIVAPLISHTVYNQSTSMSLILELPRVSSLLPPCPAIQFTDTLTVQCPCALVVRRTQTPPLSLPPPHPLLQPLLLPSRRFIREGRIGRTSLLEEWILL